MNSTSWPRLTTEELDELSRANPAMLRAERFRGAGQDARLEQLDPGDRETVQQLYAHLHGLYSVWRSDPRQPDWPEVALRTVRLAEANLIGRLKEVGRAAQGDSNAMLQRVLHDLRGGAAAAVLAEAELLEPGLRASMARGAVDSEGLEAVVFLARDQAKIMRNALIDLDPEERARDTEENPHYLDDLIERWADVDYRSFDGHARVRAAADAPAVLSSCCLEVGAVDRIVYNLVNNATRHSSDGKIAIQAQVTDDRVRLAVTNRVLGDQAGWLSRVLAEDPATLFRWGTTRGGTGLGLGIVAEFVAAAFGVPSTARAVDDGYLGSTWLGDRLAVWLHWPSYGAATWSDAASGASWEHPSPLV